MIYAEKGNRVKVIQETEIQRYVEKGYTITDGMGTVIRETVPTDMATLRLAYVEHTKEIEALKAKIAELEANAPKAKPKKSEPVTEPVDTTIEAPEVEESTDEAAEVVEEKPRRGKTAKATK